VDFVVVVVVVATHTLGSSTLCFTVFHPYRGVHADRHANISFGNGNSCGKFGKGCLGFTFCKPKGYVHGVLWRLVFPFYNSKPNQTTIHTREIKDGGW
jgi:hypothetical protein